MMNDDQSRQPTTPHNAACDELRDLLPAYVIGATTAEEAARVHELLAICPELESDIATYAGLSEGFAADVQAIQPAAHVRGGLLARLAEEEAAAYPAQPQAPAAPTLVTKAIKPKRGRRSSSWWWIAAAAAVVLLLATNALWLARVGDVQSQLTTLQQEQQELLTVLADPDVARIALHSTADQTTPLATVLWNPHNNEAILYTDALPALDSDHAYQLWVIGAQGPVSAGIFHTSASGTSFHAFAPREDMDAYQAVGISVEPASGSDQPTTNPLALGELPTTT
ncbi:MAG: anti-sigma factor [Anaerolineae bacterium]|nr:anti-sigma factor [Anaerolineae bacterium]